MLSHNPCMLVYSDANSMALLMVGQSRLECSAITGWVTMKFVNRTYMSLSG